MPLPSLQDIEAAAQVVYRDFAPTPQYRWALLQAHLDHVVQVSDDEVAAAMRAIYADTHNLAEGAGAAALAAAMQERAALRGAMRGRQPDGRQCGCVDVRRSASTTIAVRACLASVAGQFDSNCLRLM